MPRAARRLVASWICAAVTVSPDFNPLARMTWSAGTFLAPVTLIEEMVELGGELAAGVCARAARAAKRTRHAEKNAK